MDMYFLLFVCFGHYGNVAKGSFQHYIYRTEAWGSRQLKEAWKKYINRYWRQRWRVPGIIEIKKEKTKQNLLMGKAKQHLLMAPIRHEH